MEEKGRKEERKRGEVRGERHGGRIRDLVP